MGAIIGFENARDAMKDLTLRQFKKTIASATASLILLTAPGLPCLAALTETNLAGQEISAARMAKQPESTGVSEGQIGVEAAGEELAASFPAQTADTANQPKRPISSALVEPFKSSVVGVLDQIYAFFFGSVAQALGKR